MEKKLTISEVVLIRNLAAHKTPEELSRIINQPVELVKSQCLRMADKVEHLSEKKPKELKVRSTKPVSNDKPAKSKKKVKPPKNKRISHAERKVIREQEKTEKEKQKRETQSLRAQEMDRLNDRKKKLHRGTFKTKKLDLTGTIRVQLNAKTVVWVKPGTDIEQLKLQLKIK